MKYLIIGGSGFIGQNLCSKIKKEFYILDKVKPRKYKDRYVKCDVNDVRSLKKNIHSNSVIVNLAAVHRDDTFPVRKFYETNYEAAKKICRVAEIKKIRKIIFFSSVAVYGQSNNPLDETSKIGYRNHYGKSKYLAEEVYKKWQKKNYLENQLIIIRPTAIYGINNFNNVTRLLNIVKKRIVFFPGDARNIKSIAFVENLVNFTLKVIQITKQKIKIYNYADSPSLSMEDLIYLCSKHYNQNFFLLIKVNKVFIDFLIFILKKISFMSSGIHILIERIEKVKSNSIVISKENIKIKNKINTSLALKKVINATI